VGWRMVGDGFFGHHFGLLMGVGRNRLTHHHPLVFFYLSFFFCSSQNSNTTGKWNRKLCHQAAFATFAFSSYLYASYS
jgi:hypothetical protein